MRLRIIWVGKTKERCLADAAGLYLGKIRPHCDVEVVEIRERKKAPTDVALREEGRRILDASTGFVLFDERGRRTDSAGFAALLRDRPRVDFVLGGPYGVSDEVRAAAGDTVRLSDMTMMHEVARVVALEQIYRGLMINSGRSYHH